MPRLIVTQGVDLGKSFDLLDEVATIGRGKDCTIRLLDTDVARLHAKIDANTQIVDVCNDHGILINGQPSRTTQLKSGDQIQIGNTVLRYACADAIADRPPLASIPVVTRLGDDLPSRIIRTLPAAISASAENFSVLCDAIHATTQILDTDELAARVLELLFRTVTADRGCILLRESTDAELVPRAIRLRDGTSSREPIAISRSIVDHVLHSQRGVLVTDAGQDARFRAGASVVRLGIREAICVPMSGRHETLGVLYFDTLRSDSRQHMSEAELSLALAVARQAAIAVEDTRFFQAKLQSERLAAVGQAMAGLSHHIKNILQGMQSGHDVIKLGIAENDLKLIASGWPLLERNQKRIQDLVLDMLSYSKERAPILEFCSLTQVVADAVSMYQCRAIERGIQLHLHADAVPDTAGDIESIHRVVLNLVANAIDATTDAVDAEVAVHVFADPNEPFLCVAVRDNGGGIAPEQMPKLFQPFESSKGTRGTGLGLAISRKIAREHGGDLLVRNQPGHGCVFTLRIPRRDAA